MTYSTISLIEIANATSLPLCRVREITQHKSFPPPVYGNTWDKKAVLRWIADNWPLRD
jgi:hypothetical protein